MYASPPYKICYMLKQILMLLTMLDAPPYHGQLPTRWVWHSLLLVIQLVILVKGCQTFHVNSQKKKNQKLASSFSKDLRSCFLLILSCVQEPDLVRLMSEEEGSSSRLNETPDLLILSNDIPTSPTEELVMTGEEEDDPGQYYNTPWIRSFLYARQPVRPDNILIPGGHGS